jgi:uncharacterized protein (TIGR00369 family)
MSLSEMNVSFIRPAQSGTLMGRGIATRLGRKVGFIEGTLFDVDGQIVARGSGTAIPTPFPDTVAV